MQGRLKAIARRVYVVFATLTMSGIAVWVGMILIGALLPGLAHLYGFDQWESLRDRYRYGDARRIDGQLEQELATRWKQGEAFELGAILPAPVVQVCLEENPRGTPRTLDDLAGRSLRPAWWRKYESISTTLFVKRNDDRVMAYRVTSYGWPIIDNPRIAFSFRFLGTSDFACALHGKVTLHPRPSTDRYLFDVRGD